MNNTILDELLNNFNYCKKLLEEKTVMMPLSISLYDRLGHTQNVRDIASKIAKHIEKKQKHGINYKLLDVIALYHDIGHCAFGHAGEEKLNSLLYENEDSEQLKSVFYTGYKHNVLSAIRLLKETDIDVPWEVVDGVLKHTSALPKNFNLLHVKDFNILRLNYIFRLDKENASGIIIHKDWFNFIKKFNLNHPCYKCNKFKNYIVKRNLINDSYFVCEFNNNVSKFCCTKDEATSLDKAIANYFFIKEPLTLEGKIVKIADEISGFCSDIFYFAKNNMKNRSVKTFNEITNAFCCLKNSFDKSERIGKRIINLIEKIFDNPHVSEKKTLESFLISLLSFEKSKNFCENFTNGTNYCTDKINFIKNGNEIFTTIKNSIYSIIHKDISIRKNNKDGSEKLYKCYDYLYNHPDALLRMPEQKKEFEEYSRGVLKHYYKSKNDSLKLIKSDSDRIEVDSFKNCFRRQIIFYLASLNEQQIEELSKRA